MLSSREKPPEAASLAFSPLFSSLTEEEFRAVVFPAAGKMLMRNPDLTMEAVGERKGEGGRWGEGGGRACLPVQVVSEWRNGAGQACR